MPKVQPASERLYGPLARGLGRRIDDAIERVGSKTKAAEVMGISTDQLANITSERSVPNFAAMAALARQVRRSLDWFAFDAKAAAPELSTTKSFSSSDDIVFIAAADGTQKLPFSREWLGGALNLEAAQARYLHVASAAMEPTIKRGATLFLDTAGDFIDGDIYVFEIGSEYVVRRVTKDLEGNYLLRADNPIFEPMRVADLDGDKVALRGRVVWIGNRA